MRTNVAFMLVVTLSCLADDPPVRRHGSGSPDRGLPLTAAVWSPYHADPGHALNRIFRMLFLAELVPSQVGSALPREQGQTKESLRPRWMLAWRSGRESDARLFGGDGRQLPREGFTRSESRELVALLDGLDADDRDTLLSRPEMAILFQHDLLRLAQRLLDTERNQELLAPLARAISQVALDADVARRVRDPLALALSGADVARKLKERKARMPPLQALESAGKTPFREILRRSTRLFDAERTLLWSRLFLAHPDGQDALSALLAEVEQKREITAPVGMEAVLFLGIVAVDRSGAPVSTPIIVDARTQRLANRDPLGSENFTTTRDGIDFAMLQLEREGLRRNRPGRFYRYIDDDDQDLFRDYGTLKHTTYRGQCSLCHRNTGTPETGLGGFSVLRPHAQPSVATTGDERHRLAERQVATLLQKLRAATGR